MSVEVVGSWLNAFTPLLTVVAAVAGGYVQAKFAHKKSGA